MELKEVLSKACAILQSLEDRATAATAANPTEVCSIHNKDYGLVVKFTAETNTVEYDNTFYGPSSVTKKQALDRIINVIVKRELLNDLLEE